MNKSPVISKELVEYLEALTLNETKQTSLVHSPEDVANVNFNRGRLALVHHLRQLHEKQFNGKVIPDVH